MLNINVIRLTAKKQIALATSKAPLLLSKVYCDGRPGEVERSQFISCWSVEEAAKEASRLFSDKEAIQADFADESAVLSELIKARTVLLGDFELMIEDASALTHSD